MSAMMFAKDSMHSPIMIIMINDHHYHDNDGDDVRQGLHALAYQHDDHAGMMITIMATTVISAMMMMQTLLNWEPVDEDVVPPVPGHLLHLGVHLKHLQISITISITNIIIDDASYI